MSLPKWSERNESLNALRNAMQQGTHGMISDLSVDLTDGDGVAIAATSRSYHVVQLAIHATKLFAAKHPAIADFRLLLSVDGSTLELVVTHSPRNEVRDSMSTRGTNCQPRLTVPASV